jgi:hypothetical protein
VYDLVDGQVSSLCCNFAVNGILNDEISGNLKLFESMLNSN